MNFNFLTNKKTVIISFFLVIISSIAISSISNGIKIDINSAIIKLELSFLKSDFIETINLMGYEAVKAYRKILIIDFIFPFAYSIFLASFILYLQKIINNNSLTIGKIILLCIPFDCIENIFHIKFLNNPNSSTQIEYFVSACFSSIRWIIVFYAVFYIFYLLIRIFFKQKYKELS